MTVIMFTQRIDEAILNIAYELKRMNDLKEKELEFKMDKRRDES